MDNYILEYVRSCELCQMIKSRADIRAGCLIPRVASRPFEIVGTDIAIMRTAQGGNRYILVCIDYFTNWVEAAPMRRITSEEIVRTFFKIIISRHGCPDQLVSDSGTQFMSETMNQLCEQFKIKKIERAKYHQQAN
jgi:transposase InsO family protein